MAWSSTFLYKSSPNNPVIAVRRVGGLVLSDSPCCWHLIIHLIWWKWLNKMKEHVTRVGNNYYVIKTTTFSTHQYPTSVHLFGCCTSVSQSWNALIFLVNIVLEFELLTTMSTKMAVIWVLALCNLVEIYKHFRGPYYFHHQCKLLPICITLQPRI